MHIASLVLIGAAVCLCRVAGGCAAGPSSAPASPPQTQRPPGSGPPPTPVTAQPPSASPSLEGLSLDEQAHNLPGPPGNVIVAHRDGLHRVEWDGTRDDTIGGYEVHRRCSGMTWEKLAFVAVRDDDPRNRGRYRFEERHDAVCEYTVAAVTPTGTRGPMTIEIH